MKSFGIAEVERLSRTRAHTIRTWEERFGICKPVRTEGNFRSYSLGQVRYVLSLSLLNRNGYKISKLFKLSIEELNDKLDTITDIDCQCERAINELLFYMYTLDSDGFENEISKCFLNWTTSLVISSVVQPFLRLTGLEWKGNRLTEEHLVVTILRSKLLHAIETTLVSAHRNKLVLLFLQDAQDLDLSLLCIHYKLKKEGVKIIYMGNNVSIENLSILLDMAEPDYVYTYCTAKSKLPIDKLSSILSKKAPQGKMIITYYLPIEKEVAYSMENIIIANVENALQLMLQ